MLEMKIEDDIIAIVEKEIPMNEISKYMPEDE